jgi:hypothetical protein
MVESRNMTTTPIFKLRSRAEQDAQFKEIFGKPKKTEAEQRERFKEIFGKIREHRRSKVLA